MYIEFKPTLDGIFVERLNRFVALVESGGVRSRAHIATSGRLWELLVAGAPVLLEKSADPDRRTPYSLRAVSHGGVWVSIDAQVPNKLLGQALRDGSLPGFCHSKFVRSEPPYGNGRFDFLLTDDGRPVYVEVKSVTLVVNRTGFFPDAPTERGRRHLLHLAEVVRSGNRAAVIFVIQREDACSFAANKATDPAFAAALRQAVVTGVECYAYGCRVQRAGIALAERLPVLV